MTVFFRFSNRRLQWANFSLEITNNTSVSSVTYVVTWKTVQREATIRMMTCACQLIVVYSGNAMTGYVSLTTVTRLFGLNFLPLNLQPLTINPSPFGHLPFSWLVTYVLVFVYVVTTGVASSYLQITLDSFSTQNLIDYKSFNNTKKNQLVKHNIALY